MHLSRLAIENFVLQEYVGTRNSEYTVGVLHNNKGMFIGSATLKRDLTQLLSIKCNVKNLTSKRELGEQLVISSGFSQGVLYQDKKIERYCRVIAEKLGSTGPLNFQGRLVEDKFYIFEINPRFSGTSFMRALSGFNEVDLWINYLNRDHIPSFCLDSRMRYNRIIKEIKGV